MDEEPHDVLVSLPCGQVERVAALIVSDVGQGLVPQQGFHHGAAGKMKPQQDQDLYETH